MPLATSITVAIAAALGGLLGWWPLTGWVVRNLRELRVPRRGIQVVAAVTTAIVWGVVAWRVGVAPVLPAVLAFTAAATVLAIVDLAEHRLPNRVIAPTAVVVAGCLVLASAVSGAWIGLWWAILGGAAMFAAYLLLALISPGAMGMGDVKLAAVVGMLLGWFGITAWLIGLLGAFVIGGVLAIAALATRRVGLRGSIPFGPSMLAGALAGVLFVA
ncbi:prepilin peptidase [Agromyces sp. CFH 90414]|uniref:Prepilin peptidase n=1 Tax=Agromyces agglutinans TaxID=2662258 RepID=A0A6I2FA57_9MICO|nr:A24 family peptidase [Agromyces agglutinans]MRG59610.1 prepilin peptidase [Agromyces agglutinans]